MGTTVESKTISALTIHAFLMCFFSGSRLEPIKLPVMHFNAHFKGIFVYTRSISFPILAELSRYRFYAQNNSLNTLIYLLALTLKLFLLQNKLSLSSCKKISYIFIKKEKNGWKFFAFFSPTLQTYPTGRQKDSVIYDYNPKCEFLLYLFPPPPFNAFISHVVVILVGL